MTTRLDREGRREHGPAPARGPWSSLRPTRRGVLAESAAAGKDRITVRELMSHRAGLHNVRRSRRPARSCWTIDAFANALAAGSPDPRRFRGPGYHAVTYGNLVAEVAARVTGKDFTTLLREEVAKPLGVDEFWFCVPIDEHRVRIARVFPTVKPGPLPWSTTGRLLSAVPDCALSRRPAWPRSSRTSWCEVPRRTTR